jgi:hypothetical protein
MTAYRIMVAAQRTATTAPLGTRPFVRPSRCRRITPSLKGPSIFTELRGTNFRSWRSVCASSTLAEVPVDAARRAPGLTLAPVTALFGTNSSGKTSLLKILLLLRQTVESVDPTLTLNLGDDRSPIELGAFSDVQHGHAADTPVKLGVSCTTGQPREFADPGTEKSPKCRQPATPLSG